MPHPDLHRFRTLYKLADRLIVESSKEGLADVARILAMNLAQYQAKYGELPVQDYLPLVSSEKLTPETAKILADGMENLVGVLASLTGDGSEAGGDPGY